MTDPSQSSSGSSESSGWLTEQRLAYLFGTTFVVVMLVIALFVPDPSPFQQYVFRIVIGLAAAGVAATISGFLHVQISSKVRAGGAIGVFVIVYFFSPTMLITSDDTNPPSNDLGGSADTTQVDEWAPSPKAYEQATSLKVESLALMDEATDSFSDHAESARQLKVELEKAYEFAQGRPNNEISARLWKTLIDPEGNLLGGFLQRWKEASSLSAAFVTEKKKQVAEAFDTIIDLESGKIKPEDVRGDS